VSKTREVCSLTDEAREIANHLSKAAKNYQMYLSNNRMFLASLEELKQALDRYLELNDVLTFVVKEFELLHQNEPVYSNSDKYQSLAFRMYRDGIRLISFHRDISRDEIVAFLDVLARCMETDNLEEDFVTLLWEKDLQAITYYEINDFEGDDKAQKRGAPDAKAAASSSRPDSAEPHWKRVTPEIKHLMPSLTLTSDDLREVKDLAFGVEDDYFLRRAWQVIRQTFVHDDSTETYLDMENMLTGFIDTCLARRQIGIAAEALGEAKTWYAMLDEETLRQTMARIIQSRYDERNMAAIGGVLADGRQAEHEECIAYLSLLDSGALPSILRLLPRCQDQSARHVVISCMAALGRQCPDAIAGSANQDSPEEVEAVIDALDTIGSPEALTSAIRFGRHPLARIRSRVATLAGKLRTQAALELTQALIQDTDHSVKLRALASMVEIGGERSAQALVSLFTSKEFNNYPHDRKLSMLIIIRNMRPDAQEEVILAIFRMRGLFRRKAFDDTKAALVEIIHLMDQDVAGDCLEQLADHSSGKLKRAAENALRKIDNAQTSKREHSGERKKP
jgi:hypothetical protein